MSAWEVGGIIIAAAGAGGALAVILSGGLIDRRPRAVVSPRHRADFTVTDPATGHIYQPGDELPVDVPLIGEGGSRFTLRTRPDAPPALRIFDFDREATP
jgi:hypothetical protein